MPSDRPSPAVSEVGRAFWAGCADGRFMLPRCAGCGRLRWYLLPTCPRCYTVDWEWSELSGEATLFSYTVVHRSFHADFDDRIPYAVAFVLPVEDPDVRFVTRIVDCDFDRLAIGMPVRIAFTDVGGVAMPFFRPA